MSGKQEPSKQTLHSRPLWPTFTMGRDPALQAPSSACGLMNPLLLATRFRGRNPKPFFVLFNGRNREKNREFYRSRLG